MEQEEIDATVATYRYGAFGELLATGGSDAALAERNPLRYRAYYYDTHSALYYLPARYYDPASARFLSPDPAPASAGDPRTLDRYMYCTGDPVNYYDPTGAVVDVDGDGRIDSEDSISETYIHMEPDDPRKAAQREKMKAAAAAAAAQYAAAERARIAAAAAEAERERALAERERVDSSRQFWADVAQDAQFLLAVGSVLAAFTPVGLGVTIGLAAGYVLAGGARLALNDSDYSLERFVLDSTVTLVTAGVGGGVGALAARSGFKTSAYVSNVAWGGAELTMFAVDPM